MYLVSSINKHREPSMIAKNIIIKLSTNENFKPIEIWNRLSVQFGNDSPC